MRCILIDDEQPGLDLLNIIIERNEHIDIIGSYLDPIRALDDIKKLRPDVVFADIEMPNLNGMELARKIREISNDIQIIFVTAYEKYAIDAFKVQAVNYIIKPITQEELNLTVNRLMKGYNNRSDQHRNEINNRIYILGRFKVYGSAQEIVWPTVKVGELFAYCIYNRGREIDKWELCDMLWPDASAKNAEHSLYSTVNRMKLSLKKAGINSTISCKKGKYSVDFDSFYCDAWQFTEYNKNTPYVSEENILEYERMTSLYQGELFGNNHYIWAEEWLQNLKQIYIGNLKSLAMYYMGRGKYYKAQNYLQKALENDPGNEETVVLMMECCSLMGNKQAVHDTYDNLVKYLRREISIEPQKSTQQIYKYIINKDIAL